MHTACSLIAILVGLSNGFVNDFGEPIIDIFGETKTPPGFEHDFGDPMSFKLCDPTAMDIDVSEAVVIVVICDTLVAGVSVTHGSEVSLALARVDVVAMGDFNIPAAAVVRATFDILEVCHLPVNIKS